MDHQKNIGVFIRQARERQNITKETLARSLQISEAELSAWEEGVSYPALTQAPALARELAVSLDELFNARYHTVAQDYQASEACFLHEQPQPADAPDQDETKETPALQVPVESQVQSRPRLPAWTRLLLAGCLIVEAGAGCILHLSSMKMAELVLSSAVAAATLIMISVGIYIYRKHPTLRGRALLLPLPAVILMLLVMVPYLLA